MNKYQDKTVLIKIPPRLYKILDEKTVFQIGKASFSAKNLAGKIMVDPSIKSNVILVSRRLFGKKSTLPSRAFHQLNYRLMPDKIIKIGPVVGVLIAGHESSGSLPVARKARIYRQLIQIAASKNIFLYLFYADEVDWSRRIVKGILYEKPAEKGQWIKTDCCLPDIVYNRISYRYKEVTESVKDFWTQASKSSIYVFNSRFLNKWEIHQSLYNNPKTREFILETDRYSEKALYRYLTNHSEFFIKPIASSVGKGIIKIIANRLNEIKYFQLGKSTSWQTCHSPAELFRKLSITMEERYILQEAIRLANINERVFDVRAQVQKDGQGKWQFTGAAVRVAAAGKFVTHVPNGGSKRDYYATINEVFGTSSPIVEGLDKQLSTICHTVPETLEESLGINLAVLSLDIGIDQNGHMWIIEANSKPASFDEEDINQRHLDLLTDYLLFKSDFITQ